MRPLYGLTFTVRFSYEGRPLRAHVLHEAEREACAVLSALPASDRSQVREAAIICHGDAPPMVLDAERFRDTGRCRWYREEIT